MVKLLKISLTFFVLIFYSKIVHSLTSSSFLILNAAISSFDYDTASKYYSNYDYNNVNILELRRSIVLLVNSNKLSEANLLANKLIKIDNTNEDAWIVMLTFAKLNNNLSVFNEFEVLKNKNEFQMIDYVFYKNGHLNKNNEDLAEGLFNLVQTVESSSLDDQINIDYYLFYLNLALNFQPYFNEVLFFKAQIYQSLYYYEKAESIYNKIESQHGLHIEAQKNIILIKRNSDKFNEAEKLLNQLIETHPNNYSLIVLLADMYRTSNKYIKAIELYNTLINNQNKTNIELWRIYFRRGICYERTNNWKKAEKDLLKALELNPEQSQVLNYLAYGWIEKNYHIEKSITMLEIAVKKNPQSHYILDSLAWAYYKNNNFVKAVKIMEKVIEIAPGEAISLDHLGDIYFSLGRKREAFFMWIQALDLAEPEDNISENVRIKIDKYNAG